MTNSLQAQFDLMCKTGKLFRSTISGYDLWDTYLASFIDDTIYRDPESTTHNCNTCRNFIKRYGNIIAVNTDGEFITIFDNWTDLDLAPSFIAMSNMLKNAPIGDVFTEQYEALRKLCYSKDIKTSNIDFKLGLASNTKTYTKEEADKFGVVKAGEVVRFNHMSLTVPSMYINFTSESCESIMSRFRSSKEVFKTAMDTIDLGTLRLIKELIADKLLLNADTYLNKVQSFIGFKTKYDSLPVERRDSWCWETSYKLPIAGFKNELIGVLCYDIMELGLDKACLLWNKRADPSNYMKVSAPVPQSTIDKTVNFLIENLYSDSFEREIAKFEDIRASEILHINSNSKKVSIFSSIKATAVVDNKTNDFNGIPEMSIDKFMSDTLPKCDSVQLYLNPEHSDNLVVLTKPCKEDSKPIFHWDNNFSWTYSNNLAGKSFIKKAVKSAGGNIDALLRFSLIWNEDGNDNSDLDAHCMEDSSKHLYYGNKRTAYGTLDIDNQYTGGKLAVENIYYKVTPNGKYEFFVKCYQSRNQCGFRAEIELNGTLYNYESRASMRTGDIIKVATVSILNDDVVIEHQLTPTVLKADSIGGLDCNKFHNVRMVCLSPNYWGENTHGNKHYMFMLDGCAVSTPIRAYHVEQLSSELLEHKRVLELLSSRVMIEPTSEQLAGLGFNSTVPEEVVLKLSMNGVNKVVKVKL